jgi:hypothetical protein
MENTKDDNDAINLYVSLFVFLYPLSKKGGHIALLQSVGPPAVSVHFLCTG